MHTSFQNAWKIEMYFFLLLSIEIFLGPQGHLTTPNLTITTLRSEIEIHESLPFGRYCRKH